MPLGFHPGAWRVRDPRHPRRRSHDDDRQFDYRSVSARPRLAFRLRPRNGLDRDRRHRFSGEREEHQGGAMNALEKRRPSPSLSAQGLTLIAFALLYLPLATM